MDNKSIESIEPNKKNLLFLESMINLGLDEAQLEAIVQIHNAMYPEMAIDESMMDKLKNVGKAALVAGALALGTPGNADAATPDNAPISRQAPTEQVVEQDQEGAELFAEQIKQLNGKPYVIAKGEAKSMEMARNKAKHSMEVKAARVLSGSRDGELVNTSVNGKDLNVIYKFVNQNGKTAAYAFAAIDGSSK